MSRRSVVSVILILLLGITFVGYGFTVFSPNGDHTTTTTTPTTPSEPEDDVSGLIPVEEFVISTFDPVGHHMEPWPDVHVNVPGFANEPGGNSSIETTIDALELLSSLDLLDAFLLQTLFDNISEAIKDTQNFGTSFFGNWNDGSTDKLRTTALSLKALVLMDRLDSGTRSSALGYINGGFVGVTFNRWLTEGIFIQKYWGLMGCSVAGSPWFTLTVSDIDWEDYRWGTAFESLSFSTRLLALETFEWMISNRHERPEIINRLGNMNSTVTTILDNYNTTTGLFEGTPAKTAKYYHILTSVGQLELIFNEDSSSERLSLLSDRVNETVRISLDLCNPNSTISEILAMVQSWMDVQYGFSSHEELGILFRNNEKVVRSPGLEHTPSQFSFIISFV